MKRLGLDCDGVIFDFSSKFLELANARFGTDFIVLDQHDWDFKPWFSKWQIDEVWEKDIKPSKNFWMTLKPLPGTTLLHSITSANTQETLWNFKKAELFFITSRVPTAGMSCREQTCWALRNHFGITYPTVIVVDNPSQKIPVVKALELDCFIDDRFKTVEELSAAGIKTYLKLCPYNCANSLPEGVLPVETLDSFLEQELKHGE